MKEYQDNKIRKKNKAFFILIFFRYQFRYFFRYQIFPIPVPILFSGTKFFRYRYRYFFPVPNFSDTDTGTFFRYQIFPIPVPIPPKKMKIPGTGNSRYRYVTLCLEYIQSLMWRHFEEKIREGPEGCLVKSARSSHLQLEDLESNNRERL